jgi:tripartite-type tricarboxylate transporter receptor subunit TctC
VSEAVDTPTVRERFKNIGVTVPSPDRRSPEFLTKFVPSETARWAGPIKANGVSGE